MADLSSAEPNQSQVAFKKLSQLARGAVATQNMSIEKTEDKIKARRRLDCGVGSGAT